MKKISKPIIFFGSGPVAAESLRLLADEFEVEAVITKPQPSHHRRPFPVLAMAEKLGLEALTANTTEEVSALFLEKSFKSELGIIIDHGILLAPDVINSFRFGIINSHFSLLPRWRGADPISFAILSGDSETGVSLMVIAEKLDEGLLIAQESVPIPQDATTPSLTKQLITASNALLVKTLPLYIKGVIQPYPQPAVAPAYSRKLTKDDGKVDWSKPAARLEREIRAYAGWPKSYTKLGDIHVILTAAHVAEGSGKPGSLRLSSKELAVYCGEDVLVIDSLIPTGKKDMPARSFLAGYRDNLC